MNNKSTIIAVVAVVIVAGVGLLAAKKFIFTKPSPVQPSVTPSPALESLDKNVDVALTANTQKNKVTLKISGLNGKYKALEYELSYNTEDKGIQGNLSGSKPLAIPEGSDEFVREIELGTCSSGKCVYYLGITAITTSIKLYTVDDKTQSFKKDFEI